MAEDQFNYDAGQLREERFDYLVRGGILLIGEEEEKSLE